MPSISPWRASTAPWPSASPHQQPERRAFTATSANGLLYMNEQLHWAVGARLPIVMCVVNRGIGAPWTVWNDHQDSISQRDVGWIQIYANDHQQIIDSVIKAFRSRGDRQHPGHGLL